MSKNVTQLLENFRKTITMVRGKKYTFIINGIEDDGTKNEFYISTDATGGANFPGVVTENVENSYERVVNGDFSKNSDWDISNQWSIDTGSNEADIDGSQTTEASISQNVNTVVGNHYLVSFEAVRYSGTITPKVGTTSGTAINSGGTYATYSEVIKATGSKIFFVADADFYGSIKNVSVKEVGVSNGNLVFTPSYDHPNTLYYQCGQHSNMGGQINIVNEPGAVLNDQEYYFTLGINQTNRTYPPTMKSDPKILSKFLKSGLPAGVFKNIFNRAPEGSIYSDRAYNEYYDAPNGDNIVTLSGLISDPEKDTLKYKWKHYSPKKTMDGVSLLTDFTDDQSVDTTATLVTPPTDMIYTLHLEVQDSDNITTLPINIKVSGSVDFENWAVGSGQSTFDLGDSNVPFGDLD